MLELRVQLVQPESKVLPEQRETLELRAQLVLERLASKVQRVSRGPQESKVPLVLMARLELRVLLEMLELREYKVMSGQLERLELVKQELQELRALMVLQELLA